MYVINELSDSSTSTPSPLLHLFHLHRQSLQSSIILHSMKIYSSWIIILQIVRLFIVMTRILDYYDSIIFTYKFTWPKYSSSMTQKNRWCFGHYKVIFVLSSFMSCLEYSIIMTQFIHMFPWLKYSFSMTQKHKV